MKKKAVSFSAACVILFKVNDSPIFPVATVKIYYYCYYRSCTLDCARDAIPDRRVAESASRPRLVTHKTHEMTARVCAVENIYFLYFYIHAVYIFRRPYVTNKISFLT